MVLVKVRLWRDMVTVLVSGHGYGDVGGKNSDKLRKDSEYYNIKIL